MPAPLTTPSEGRNHANYFPPIAVAALSPDAFGKPLDLQCFSGSSIELEHGLPRARVSLGIGEGFSDLSSDTPIPAPIRSRPGKGTKRPVDRRCLSTSSSLTHDQYLELNTAWDHARRIGLPLNWFLTIRPSEMDDLTPGERQKLWQRTYKRLEEYARKKGFIWTAIWSRESIYKTNLGEHFHILLHLPKGQDKHLRKTVAGWFHGRRAVDLRSAPQDVDYVDGKYRTAATYVTKAAPWSIRNAFPDVPSRHSGTIFGRRAGCTRNIGHKVQAAHNARPGRPVLDA